MPAFVCGFVEPISVFQYSTSSFEAEEPSLLCWEEEDGAENANVRGYARDRSADDRERARSLRIIRRKLHRNRASHFGADDVRRVHSEMVEKTRQGGRQAWHGPFKILRDRGISKSGQVRPNEAKLLSHSRNPSEPGNAGFVVAVDEQGSLGFHPGRAEPVVPVEQLVSRPGGRGRLRIGGAAFRLAWCESTHRAQFRR